MTDTKTDRQTDTICSAISDHKLEVFWQHTLHYESPCTCIMRTKSRPTVCRRYATARSGEIKSRQIRRFAHHFTASGHAADSCLSELYVLKASVIPMCL